MNLLFDTQALIAWSTGKHFRPSVKRIIERASTTLFVSVITPWEATLKPQLRKTGITNRSLWETVENLGANILALRREHVDACAQLPAYPEHRDPFDRMLIAQAISENLTLVGADARFELYPELKVLW